MSDKEKAAWGYLTWVDKSPDVRPSAEGEEAFFAGAEWGEKNKWIKCSERLPEEHKAVLVFPDSVGEVGMGVFCGECWLDSTGLNERVEIIKWQPLPEAPKEEE